MWQARSRREVPAAPVEYIALAATCAAVSYFAPSPVVAYLAPARTTAGQGRTVSPPPFRGPPSAKQFRGWSPRGPVDAGENLAFHLDDQVDGKLRITRELSQTRAWSLHGREVSDCL